MTIALMNLRDFFLTQARVTVKGDLYKDLFALNKAKTWTQQGTVLV